MEASGGRGRETGAENARAGGRETGAEGGRAGGPETGAESGRAGGRETGAESARAGGETAGADGAGRDREAVLRFIERFASALADAGMPRMPARVFAGLLATDAGRLTAAELAELLHVSPAAVSGALRYLMQVNVLTRERQPGSRRDHYRLLDDTWYEMTLRREQLMARWIAAGREGVEALGPETPAGARMAESVAFFEFVREELPALIERWRSRRSRA